MKQPVYFDYCATTPLHPEVRAAMRTALEEGFGNPSSMHTAGQTAAALRETARSEVAAALGCQPEEIVFTSGATESDNLALLGVMRQYEPGKAHLITSSIEHHAVLHTAQQLEKEGYAVTYLPVDASGRVSPHDAAAAMRANTVLISVMMVNNETGAIQPIEQICAAARARGILFHTDAVQAVGLESFYGIGRFADLLSISAHKIHGPKGAGALFVRKGVRLLPQLFGGPQEGGLRPGTENIPGIVGLGAAARLIGAGRAQQQSHLRRLRQKMIEGLQDRISGIMINGPQEQTAPHVLSVSFIGANGEMLLLQLNALGFAASMGSACTSRDIEPSHVLAAMGLPREQIESTLRISFGKPTTEEEVEAFLSAAAAVVKRARILSEET